jgi:CxxC motif-containing protein
MSDDHIFHYLCIGCPLGCHLEVDDTAADAAEGVKVTGWTCKTGKAYGEQEHKDPRRNIATSVRIKGARWGRVPVKTSTTIPKRMVREVARAVQDIEVEAPIKLGTVVLADVLGTGADIVATRDMERA